MKNIKIIKINRKKYLKITKKNNKKKIKLIYTHLFLKNNYFIPLFILLFFYAFL